MKTEVETKRVENGEQLRKMKANEGKDVVFDSEDGRWKRGKRRQ